MSEVLLLESSSENGMLAMLPLKSPPAGVAVRARTDSSLLVLTIVCEWSSPGRNRLYAALTAMKETLKCVFICDNWVKGSA